MSQYAGDTANAMQQQQQEMTSTSSANTSPNGLQFFTNDTSQLYYDSSGMIDSNGMIYLKTGGLMGTQSVVTMNGNTVYTTCTSSQQQLVANSSHCTTPQTPTSIPDIILTGLFSQDCLFTCKTNL